MCSTQSFYASMDSSTVLDSLQVQDLDIAYFNGTTWSMFFDASDVGISSGDLNDFFLLDADTLLLTFEDPLTLGAVSVDPWDIVRFDATSLGSTTTGTFSLYFDGNDVGLDNLEDEIVDGFDLLPDGRLLFSTEGSFAVPGLSGKDEDIIAFTPTTLGDTTSGTWAMYFDGSLSGIGLGNSGEDLDAVDVAPNGDIYLSTEDVFAVSGISGNEEDVFVCTPTFTGSAVTSCTYSSTLFFDGSTWGVEEDGVDGLYLP